MQTTIETGTRPKRAPLMMATLLAGFALMAVLVDRAIGCPLAGCSNAAIALTAGVALALLLGTLLTHTDRLAAHKRLRKVAPSSAQSLRRT